MKTDTNKHKDWEQEFANLGVKMPEASYPKLKALIMEEVRAGRIDEIKRFAATNGSLNKNETWKDWSWRVYHYCKDRLAQLTREHGGSDE